MTYEICSDVPLPGPNGRAGRGPKLHKLDEEAIAGIQSGLYINELDAAKNLAPKYRPNIWKGANKEQKREYIKSKCKLYRKMLARLDP